MIAERSMEMDRTFVSAYDLCHIDCFSRIQDGSCPPAARVSTTRTTRTRSTI